MKQECTAAFLEQGWTGINTASAFLAIEVHHEFLYAHVEASDIPEDICAHRAVSKMKRKQLSMWNRERETFILGHSSINLFLI